MYGCEYWSARKLAKTLEYSEYRHFLPAIEKPKEACRNSVHSIEEHFEDILEMVD
jgi:DNA-damage-inducible protein D